jgi:hypothetical protein
MSSITHTKSEAFSWREFVIVILTSTETSVKLTVPFVNDPLQGKDVLYSPMGEGLLC